MLDFPMIFIWERRTSRRGGFPGRDVEEMYGRCTLIQKAECPQRDDMSFHIFVICKRHKDTNNPLAELKY